MSVPFLVYDYACFIQNGMQLCTAKISFLIMFLVTFMHPQLHPCFETLKNTHISARLQRRGREFEPLRFHQRKHRWKRLISSLSAVFFMRSN